MHDGPQQAWGPLKCSLKCPFAQGSMASDTSSVVNMRRRQHLQSALVEKLLNKYYPGSFVVLSLMRTSRQPGSCRTPFGGLVCPLRSALRSPGAF